MTKRRRGEEQASDWKGQIRRWRTVKRRWTGTEREIVRRGGGGRKRRREEEEEGGRGGGRGGGRKRRREEEEGEENSLFSLFCPSIYTLCGRADCVVWKHHRQHNNVFSLVKTCCLHYPQCPSSSDCSDNECLILNFYLYSWRPHIKWHNKSTSLGYVWIRTRHTYPTNISSIQHL